MKTISICILSFLAFSLIVAVSMLVMETTPIVIKKKENLVMILNESNFEEEVLKSEKPVLVDFWAPWCGPCNALFPTMEALAENHSVGKVNIDENSELATTYEISSIPALLFFKDGKVAKKLVGIQQQAALEKVFEELSK
jgi:thioredoxin 1